MALVARSHMFRGVASACGALACALALVPLHGARAQVEGDIDLIKTQNTAPPNVVILLDTSEGMRHVGWHEDFDPALFYDSSGAARFCSGLSVPAKVGTDGECPDGNGPNGKCPDNSGPGQYMLAGQQVVCRATDFPARCNGWTIGACSFTTSKGANEIRFTLPNYAQAPYTARWSKNYLNFLVNYLATNGTLPPSLPTVTRMATAKQVVAELVDRVNPTRANGTIEDNVRFGLARFDTRFADASNEPMPASPNADSDVLLDPNNAGQGGYLVVPVGQGNKGTIVTALNALRPIDYVPLSEALIDVGRYFVGGHANPSGGVGLGVYPVYDRNTTDGRSTASPPGSPISAAADCQKNFVILVTNGDPLSDENNDDFGSGNSTFNGTFTSDYDNDKNDPGPVHTRDYLDDVAAYLNQEDLIADSEIPEQQNVVTYTVGFAIDSRLLEETAGNGGGEYFTTSTATGLADALVRAIDDILLRSATFTSASVPTSRQSFGDAFFVTYLEPRPQGELWVGHLQAFRLSESFEILGQTGPAIDPATGLFFEPRAPFWDTQTVLHDPLFARNLLTTKSPRAFTAANIAAADLAITAADLNAYPNDPATPFTSIEVLADAVVSWVYGRDAFDKNRDGDTTELREAVLGDIFHSNPLTLAAPAPFLTAEPGFGPIGDPTSFFGQYSDRDRVIYAGANDGMLHGVDAGQLVLGDNPATPSVTETAYYSIGSGDELFGYIPSFLLPRIKELPMRGAKPFYVDGTPSAADVWLPASTTDTTKGASEWTTALVIGMRNGGDGYLALDVTDPSATTGAHGPYPKLLWEFSDASEAVGRTWSEPVITRVKLSGGVSGDFCGADNGEGASATNPEGSCREEWVAIFGGGYREAADPNNGAFVGNPSSASFDTDGRSIYIVRMTTGEVLAKAVFSATDAQLSTMLYAMPSQPAVIDGDFDGFADTVYIGDLGGQMWKWDISAIATPSGAGLVSTSTWPIGRLFTAPVASNGHFRSLFNPPSVSQAGAKLKLAFGSGERTAVDYEGTAGVDENRFYVLTDPNPMGALAIPSTPFTESDLSDLTDQLTDPDLTDLGFYFVGAPGEKFLSDHVTIGGFVVTTSFTPDPAASAALCAAKGNAQLLIFSVVDGAGFYDTAATAEGTRRLSIGGGLPTNPTVVRSNLAGTRVVVQTSDGRVLTSSGPATEDGGTQIIFWREVW
jgi:type IV pilus assembly protein PilY1